LLKIMVSPYVVLLDDLSYIIIIDTLGFRLIIVVDCNWYWVEYEVDLLVMLPTVEIGFIWLWIIFHEFRISVGVHFDVKGWMVNG
jgi:hypothetical protein